MRRRRLGIGIIAAIPVVVLGLLLAVWFIPSGPSISGGGNGTGFNEGYVDNHYTVWTAFTIHHAFVAEHADVITNDHGCGGTIRLVGKPVVGGYLAGVSAGPLPGVSVIGRRLTPQLSPQLAIVLTPSGTGKCAAKTVRFATHTWGRTRWTTLAAYFNVNVNHRTGLDSRTNESSPPAL